MCFSFAILGIGLHDVDICCLFTDTGNILVSSRLHYSLSILGFSPPPTPHIHSSLEDLGWRSRLYYRSHK